MGVTGIFKTGIKTIVDGTLDLTISTMNGIMADGPARSPYSPTVERRNSEKRDAVRRAFKYESLVYHSWRSIWCTYITIIAFYNYLRLNAEFDRIYTSHGIPIPYHSYYDPKTSWDITMVICFFAIDLLIYSIRGKFMSKSVIIHHLLGIALCSIALFVKYPHHYHANLFMCAEIVSVLTVLSHFAKKQKSKLLYKIYLFQYLILTIVARGWIWYTVAGDLIRNNVGVFCYFGLAPLVIMDVLWSKQCIDGIRK